ncbi:hypothetical protein G5B35_05340 [Parapusillimonas sp. SGNA-6]|nr:hypothetical protein [Parapusillimonas sp. SGNA-6]
MKKRFFLGLLSASLALSAHAAADVPAPGQKLSDAQIAEWGDLPMYRIGRSTFRMIPVRPANGQATLLLNTQGVVGISHNDIAISRVSAETARARLKQIVPQPLSIEHFEKAGVTVARFADFGQAVAGMQAIKAALPEAQVRLPVQFSSQVPY